MKSIDALLAGSNHWFHQSGGDGSALKGVGAALYNAVASPPPAATAIALALA